MTKACSAIVVVTVAVITLATQNHGFIYTGQLFCNQETCFVVPPSRSSHKAGNSFPKEGSGTDDEGGRIKGTGSGEILGGLPASIRQFPYQVSVYFRNTAGKTEGCGGTVLSKYIILTAAHCVCSYENNKQVVFTEMEIGAGSEQRFFSGQQRNVSTVIPHPDFKGPQSFANDLALIVLDNPLILAPGNVEVLPLADFELRDEVTCVLSGWGVTESGNNSNYLRYTKVRLAPSHECSLEYRSYDKKTQVCYGGEGHNSCPGDSGGPLACRHPRTRELFLYGMVSFGRDFKCSGTPSVATRVSYWRRRWIQRTARVATYSLPGQNWNPPQPQLNPFVWMPPEGAFPFWPFLGLQHGKVNNMHHERFSASFGKPLGFE